MVVSRTWLIYSLVISVLLLCPELSWADGGTLRFSKLSGGYRITLFTSPTSLRAGLVDFSVLVQSAESETPLPDLPVTIHVYPDGKPLGRHGGTATTAAATNKLFRAIQLELTEPGLWHVEVEVHSPDRSALIDTEMEVGSPLPSWIDLGMWIGWPAGVILLFVIHLCLVASRTGGQPLKPEGGRTNRRQTANQSSSGPQVRWPIIEEYNHAS